MFDSEIVATCKSKVTLTLNKPVYVGICVLDLSRVYAGFVWNVVKWSVKVVKAVCEYPQWLGVASWNFEMLTSLNSLKLYSWRFFCIKWTKQLE